MEPDQRVADFAKAGSDIITVHAEQSATIHLHRLIGQVPGLSLSWPLLGCPRCQRARAGSTWQGGPPFQPAAAHCSRLCCAMQACLIS